MESVLSIKRIERLLFSKEKRISLLCKKNREESLLSIEIIERLLFSREKESLFSIERIERGLSSL